MTEIISRAPEKNPWKRIGNPRERHLSRRIERLFFPSALSSLVQVSPDVNVNVFWLYGAKYRLRANVFLRSALCCIHNTEYPSLLPDRIRLAVGSDPHNILISERHISTPPVEELLTVNVVVSSCAEQIAPICKRIKIRTPRRTTFRRPHHGVIFDLCLGHRFRALHTLVGLRF